MLGFKSSTAKRIVRDYRKTGKLTIFKQEMNKEVSISKKEQLIQNQNIQTGEFKTE